jgi:hypothetical protein
LQQPTDYRCDKDDEMDNYGEAYKRELERIKGEARAAKRAPKATFDVRKTMERFQQIVDDLQSAGAPVSTRPSTQIQPGTYSLSMAIGETEYEVLFFNDTIKVFWRGRDKTPMVYDALSHSRLNALARVIIERAVASAVAQEAKPRPATPRVVKFPQQ